MPDIFSYDLIEAMRRPGCPLCRALAGSVDMYIRSFVRDGRFTPKPRERFFRAGGFCHRHAWMVHGRSVQLGTGAPVVDLYRNVVLRDLAALDGMLGKLPRGRRARRRTRRWTLSRHDSCLACEHERESIGRKSEFLADVLREEAVWDAYRRSDGLCYPHLHTVTAVADDDVAHALIADWRDRIAKLNELLEDYERRRDYRYAHEPKGEEQGSWTKVIERYVGRNSSEASEP